MKRWALLFALVLTVTAVGGALAETFPEAPYQQDPLAIPTDVPMTDVADPWADYDPASEEGGEDDYYPDTSYDEYGRQIYAGATPIPLYPIDMPTATPKPTLAFGFGDVTADNIGIAFQAPVGWGIEMPDTETVILTDPNAYDGVNATMTVRILAVPSSFKLADVRTELSAMLKDIGQYNFTEFKPTSLNSRTLLKKDGYYADYSGTYYDGTAVYGRVMMALLDGNRIITLHLVCPGGFFNSSYKNVVNHFRDTVRFL